LIDDRGPHPAPGGIGDVVVGEDKSTSVNDPEHKQEQDRENEGELDQGLTAITKDREVRSHGA
jgi:hypothetical protein